MRDLRDYAKKSGKRREVAAQSRVALDRGREHELKLVGRADRRHLNRIDGGELGLVDARHVAKFGGDG